MGAWGHRAYDNDTGEEWLDGLAESLKFMLLRAFWSRWQEEGIAAARLLCDIPQVLQDRIGSQPFVEALEVVEAEQKPEALKLWKSPAKRARFLRTLHGELTDFHDALVKLEAAHRKRIAQHIVIKRKAPKIRPAPKSRSKATHGGRPVQPEAQTSGPSRQNKKMKKQPDYREGIA